IFLDFYSNFQKPGFIEPQNGVNIFKKLELKGFSMYWNSDAKMSKDIDIPKNLRDILAPENTPSTFIIHPCSAELRMERNSSKFPLKGPTPRFKFFLRPEKITVEMTRRQIAELRALNREWARFERARQHRKWRPLTHVGEKRSSAESINASKGSPSKGSTPAAGSHEDVAIMKQIERDSQYTYHELHLFRETVFRRIMREKSKTKGVELSALAEDTFETIDSPLEGDTVFTFTEPSTKGRRSWIVWMDN
ncbi:hypothetical protein OSTOST_18364, partial [Ostertagia ostertagi]